jgi:hypothetical protein
MKTQRTFKKSKQRKKRPYHKKVTISYLRLAKSTMIGMIPLIVICIGLTTSVLINSKALDRYNNLQIHIPFPEYTLPKVYIPNIAAITSSFLQKMITSVSSLRITPPKITIPSVNFSLPQVDITPFLRQAQQLLTHYFTLLNPFPLLQAISREVMQILIDEVNIFVGNIIHTVAIIDTILLSIATIAQQTLTGIYGMVAMIIIILIRSLQNTILLIHSLANTLVQQIQSSMSAVFKTIEIFLIFVWGEIELFTKLLWKIVTLPFITIQRELQLLSPYFKELTTLLAKPINEFTQSISNLVSLIATISKHESN